VGQVFWLLPMVYAQIVKTTLLGTGEVGVPLHCTAPLADTPSVRQKYLWTVTFAPLLEMPCKDVAALTTFVFRACLWAAT
jgi:hypothetical protein